MDIELEENVSIKILVEDVDDFSNRSTHIEVTSKGPKVESDIESDSYFSLEFSSQSEKGSEEYDSQFSDGIESESDYDSNFDLNFVIETQSNNNLELDNITREESEERINILLIALAVFTLILAMTLLCLQPEKPNIIILMPETKLETYGPKVPHILLIYFQGATIDYVVHPKLSKSADLGNFPDSDVYLPFYDSENLYIAYGNGNLDTTKWHNGKHRRITNSKFPLKFLSNALSVRIGEFIWVLGLSTMKSDAHSYSLFLQGLLYMQSFNPFLDETDLSITYLWSFRKERWFRGPSFNFKNEIFHTETSCITNINRTHLILIGSFSNRTTSKYSKAVMINASDVWTYTVLDNFDILGTKFKCSSVIDKNGHIKVFVSYTTEFVSPHIWNFAIFDTSNEKITKVTTTFQDFDIDSIVFSSGIVHLFVKPNVERVLGFTWNLRNSSFDTMETLGVQFDKKYKTALPKYNRVIAVEHYI